MRNFFRLKNQHYNQQFFRMFSLIKKKKITFFARVVSEMGYSQPVCLMVELLDRDRIPLSGKFQYLIMIRKNLTT